MKTHLVRVSMLVLVAAAGWAQDPFPLRANVPFNFIASGVTMPAGHYLVSPGAFRGAIELRADDTGRRVIVATESAEAMTAPATAKLVFRRYGDQYFLAETWSPTSTFGRRIPQTKQERLLARGQSTPSRIVIAASK